MHANIRTAEQSDSESISALAVETYARAFGHSFSAGDLRAHLERELSPRAFERILEEEIVLVAELSERIIGYVQFGPAVERPREAELRRLYVHPDFQRQGIGSRLMEAALSHPFLTRVRLISLDVWVHNDGAQRFYRRYGFRPAGTRRFAVASGAETTPDIIMVRDRDAM